MDLYVNVHVFHRSQDVELQNQTPLCYVTWNIYSVTFLVPSVHFLFDRLNPQGRENMNSQFVDNRDVN